MDKMAFARFARWSCIFLLIEQGVGIALMITDRDWISALFFTVPTYFIGSSYRAVDSWIKRQKSDDAEQPEEEVDLTGEYPCL